MSFAYNPSVRGSALLGQSKLSLRDPLLDGEDQSSSPWKLHSVAAEEGEGAAKATSKGRKAIISPLVPEKSKAHEESLNKGNSIDFNAQLDALKRRTEQEVPYTITQVEDAMYLDQANVVTLEFAYYQNDCEYSNFQAAEEHIDHRGTLMNDHTGQPADHLLGTQNYQASESTANEDSQFLRQDVINYVDEGIDILAKDAREKSHVFTRIEVPNDQFKMSGLRKKSFSDILNRKSLKEDSFKTLEAVIALYKVSKSGSMQRTHEVEMKMGRNFMPTKNGNMQLTRSRDKSLISIVNFDKNDPDANYFKLMAWTVKLVPHDVDVRLNEGMNLYLHGVKESFEELVEVAFVGRCQYVLLTYIEKQPRPEQEQQAYERLLDSNTDGVRGKLGGFGLGKRKRNKMPRKAKKYIFFNAQNGRVVFEYGGVKSPIDVTNQNGKLVQIFELGMLIKEVREDRWQPKLYFFTAGDFWSDDFKEKQFMFKWCLCTLAIDMDELFSYGSQDDILNYLKQEIIKNVPQGNLEDSQFSETHVSDDSDVYRDAVYRNARTGQEKSSAVRQQETMEHEGQHGEDNGNHRTRRVSSHSVHYLFDEHWILHQQFSWEMNISVSANRSFEQFAFINSPNEAEWKNSFQSYYINGSKFLAEDEQMEIPYLVKIPNNCTVTHGRNAFLKNELFYDINRNGETRTMCLRIDHVQEERRVKPFNIGVSNYLSTPDNYLMTAKKKSGNQNYIDICQNISVQKGDQYALLQTRFPTKFTGTIPCEYMMITRKTNQFLQQIGNFPFFAYNLGDQKIVVQNINEAGKRKAYILRMQPDEKFVCFIEFNKYEEIGFNPEGLRIECCSHFAFLTRKDDGVGGDKFSGNKMNLLQIDAFQPHLTACLFKSHTNYDNEIFNMSDFIIKCVVQYCTGRQGQKKTYLWTQFASNLCRSKMFHPESKIAEDSDNAMEDDELIIYENQEDEFDELQNNPFEKLKMIQDKQGFIYYVTQNNGESFVMEGNPKDPYIQHHRKIFTIKTQRCLAFSLNQNCFYLMDSNYVVYKLVTNPADRQLEIANEQTLKDIQRLDYIPDDFDNQILDDQYSIFKSKIFYFYKCGKDPFPEGIFDAEDIVSEDKQQIPKEFMKGPCLMIGSNQFFCVLRSGKYKSFIKLVQQPDKVAKSLVNDFQNYCDVSSFLENGNILVKCRRRYMIFTSEGSFIDEVEFNNDALEAEEKSICKDHASEYCSQEVSVENISSDEEQKKKKDKNKKVRKKREIIDFKGNIYQLKQKAIEPVLCDANKMELLQFSFKNKFYLFFDRIMGKMLVYELCKVRAHDSRTCLHGRSSSEAYEFVLRYILNTLDAYIFKYLSLNNMDGIKYFRQNPGQIQVDDRGNVKMCFCINFGSAEAFDDDKSGEDARARDITCKMIVNIFKQEGKSCASVSTSFVEVVDFPLVAQTNLELIVDAQIKAIERKIKNIHTMQSRWPEILHDYSEYDNLWKYLMELESKDESITFSRFFNDDLIIIFCGNYLKFAKVEQLKPDVYSLKDFDGVKFKDINLTFSDDTEIIKLIETTNKNFLQILAKNHQKNIIFIITWDFEQNIERSMYQVLPSHSTTIGTHIVKGMNLKLNYYVDEDYLIDLECNIPIRQRNVNQLVDIKAVSYSKQLNLIDKICNQRKLFEDNSKFLGIEKPHELFFNLTRIDILLWKGINAVGETPELVDLLSNIDSLNHSFGGVSLFHYFAKDAKIIQVINNKMLKESSSGELSRTERTLPLQIVNPDNEGKTALYRAVANQSLRSFELMIEMMKDNSNLCITKTILHSLTLILLNEQESVVNFFEGAFYQPPQMKIDWFVPWNENDEEFVFTSHTSLISQKLLLTKLQEHGVEVNEPIKKKHRDHHTEEAEDAANANIHLKKQVNQLKLLRQFETGLQEGEQPLRRVTVEVLDFDWIFENSNAKILLAVLANDASDTAITRRSIRLFIRLMWSYYKNKIIYFVFLPYCVYLFIIQYLSGHVIGRFLYALSPYDPNPADLGWNKLSAWILTPIGATLLCIFGSLEVRQLFQGGFEYFQDPWNCIDMASLYLNASFLSMFIICIYREEEYFNMDFMHLIGAFACFFMWIKIFYWMRLFSSLAYYVKLIQQTIQDICSFMLMVLIIFISFAAFFYVADRNLVGTPDSYMGKYFDNRIIDSVISIYVIGSLGDFLPSKFTVGYEAKAVMLMFILSTFLVSVVFMNMLISIMGHTYGQVSENAEQNGLREQIVLIADHIWLIDLEKIFRGQKYIMRIAPLQEETEMYDPITDCIRDTRDFIYRSVNAMNLDLEKRIQKFDVNMRHSLIHQLEAIQHCLNHFQEQEQYAKMLEKQKREEEQPSFVLIGGSLLESKKHELARLVNLNNIDLSNLDSEKIYQLSLDFCTLVDKGNSGELEYEEFYDFFSNAEDIFLTDDQIWQLFNEIDISGDGCISLQEFARALTIVIEATKQTDEII